MLDPVPAHPYTGRPAHTFWRRSVSALEPHLVDPVTQPRFTVDKNTRVATAGSCFAQHISRRISRSGYRYLVTEDGSHLPEEERANGNYGLFPARFGNIYTPVQLLQLFQECFGQRSTRAEAWQRPDGRYVDPVRQQVDPSGFATPDCVADDRARHLAHVRQMFEQMDVFIFTLGLTEAWRCKADGTVFSSAPGVVGGTFDAARHEFVNFSLQQTDAALREFLAGLRQVNPAAQVLLTVSPVPLMATFTDRSVLVANSYSKSVLRVAAEMAVQDHAWVDYFASYEIITGSFAGGLYYEADHREVNGLGVAHAMRCFMRHYTAEGEGVDRASPAFSGDHGASRDVLCDEDVLDAARA